MYVTDGIKEAHWHGHASIIYLAHTSQLSAEWPESALLAALQARTHDLTQSHYILASAVAFQGPSSV